MRQGGKVSRILVAHKDVHLRCIIAILIHYDKVQAAFLVIQNQKAACIQ